MSWLMNTKADRSLLDGVVALINATDAVFETTRYDIRWESERGNVYHYEHLRHVSGDIAIVRPADPSMGIAKNVVTIGNHEIVPSRIYRRRICQAFERRDIRAASVLLSDRLIGANTTPRGIARLEAG